MSHVATWAFYSALAFGALGMAISLIRGLRMKDAQNPVLILFNMTSNHPGHTPSAHACWNIAYISWQVAVGAFITGLILK